MNNVLRELKNRYGDLFPKIFCSIIADNGSEFSKLSNILEEYKSEAYFAHSYSSWERASNERQNGIIRRFIPKSRAIRGIPLSEAKDIEKWMNEYPRKMLGYKTSKECFYEKILRICENRETK
ncbi:IS30 family transposase [Caldicoprobacter algeriensis]|nr:IS30 family transposase [Caldicoprobacter algeriensis]